MRRLGGFLLIAAGVALILAQSVRAAGRRADSFDSLTKSLAEHYSVKPNRIPLMWLASLYARGITHDGVRGLKVIKFDSFGEVRDRTGFEAVVRSALGEDWSQAVRQREASGGESLVYMRAEGRRTELVVIDLNHGELDLVRMEMNPDRLARWSRGEEKVSVQ